MDDQILTAQISVKEYGFKTSTVQMKTIVFRRNPIKNKITINNKIIEKINTLRDK